MCLWIFFIQRQMYLSRPTEDLGIDSILVSNGFLFLKVVRLFEWAAHFLLFDFISPGRIDFACLQSAVIKSWSRLLLANPWLVWATCTYSLYVVRFISTGLGSLLFVFTFFACHRSCLPRRDMIEKPQLRERFCQSVTTANIFLLKLNPANLSTEKNTGVFGTRFFPQY